MDDKQLKRVGEVLEEAKAKERAKRKEPDGGSRDAASVRAESRGKGKVTADKWNQ